MLKAAGMVTLVLLLAGCEDRETARARNEQRLPPGCRIIDMDYGDLRAAVVCDGRKSTTSLRAWDETIYVYDVNLKMMMPQTSHYTSLSAEIGPQ
jgi:hypothetical protein